MKDDSFAAMVVEAANRWGANAGDLADRLIGAVCPKSAEAARAENVFTWLREGMVRAIKRILRTSRRGATIDFSELFRDFPAARDLKSTAYYVEDDDEEISVAELVDDPDRLLAAAEYMKRKGDECHAEAARLFALYDAVIAKRRARAEPEHEPA